MTQVTPTWAVDIYICSNAELLDAPYRGTPDEAESVNEILQPAEEYLGEAIGVCPKRVSAFSHWRGGRLSPDQADFYVFPLAAHVYHRELDVDEAMDVSGIGDIDDLPWTEWHRAKWKDIPPVIRQGLEHALERAADLTASV